METTKNIYQRILGVMADVSYVEKGEKKVNNQYKYVSHDQVNSVLHPAFVKHGIVVIPTVVSMNQDGNRTSVCLRTDFVNADNPNEKIDVISWGYGIDSSDKGPGKAVSYAYKYALLKTFCLETGDDPDQDQNTKYEAPKVEEVKKEAISSKQLRVIEDLLDKCDELVVKNAEEYFQNKYGINDWSELNNEQFQILFNTLTQKIKSQKAVI